jgi:AraC-like DNA-binding protein
MRVTSNSKMLVLKVPRRKLEHRIGRSSDFVGRRSGSEGVVGFFSSSLVKLSEHIGSLDASSHDTIETQFLDLLALALGHRSQNLMLSSPKAHHLIKLRSVMASRLSEPGLNVREIAAKAGLSVRYANALLADQGQSVSEMLQLMRLDRCKRAFEDSSQAHRTIGEIAYAWGFSDLTHFGRRFKRTYGVLPSEFRNEANRAAERRSASFLDESKSQDLTMPGASQQADE